MLTLCIDISKKQADAWLINTNDGVSSTEKLCNFVAPDLAPLPSSASPATVAAPQLDDMPLAEPTWDQILLDKVSPLRARLDKIVLVTDGSQILSRSVKLPFVDPKRVSQLLLPEVADQVPFELDTFVIAQTTPTTVAGGFLFPILIIENSKLDALLKVLQTASIEANEIVLPSSFIPEEEAGVVGVTILESGNYLYLRLLTPERSLQRIIPLDSRERALQEVRQTMLFFERESGLHIKKLTAVTSIEFGEYLQSKLPQSFQQEYRQTPLIDLVTAAIKKNLPLESLRVGKYSFRVKLGRLLKSFSASLPYAGLGALLVMFGIVGFSSARSSAISDLQSSSAAAIKKAAPEFNSLPDEEVLTALQGKNKDLEQQLQALGSPSKFSPLSILKDVSSDFPSGGTISVTGLRIRGDELTLEGSAPDYEGIEKIEKALKGKRSTFCRVSKDVSGSAQGRNPGRGFTFTIKLCD